jgi:beta-glucosidase
MLCRQAAFLLLHVFMGSAMAGEAEAPRVDTGGAITVRLTRPEMFKPGWVDLDKDGVKSPFEDPTLPIESRIDDLLRRMTLDEKIGQCCQYPMGGDSPQKDEALLAKGGIGSYLGVDSAGPGLRNSLQRIAVEESRLGIPLVFGYDTIHGFRTIFPIPLAQSCAWDPQLLERTHAVAARESKDAGIDWVFAPMIDIARDPRWGRIAEGYGEDPWLDGVLVAGAIRGLQGDDAGRPDRVAACLKHYVGYGAAEGGCDYNTTEIGLPTLRNIYLPPFKAGVAAGALSIMSAFNCLNGVPTSGNRFTLTDILRGEWRFDGLVVSDWESVKELIDHGFAADEAAAARLGMNAGVDMEMASHCYQRNLAALIAAGSVSQATLDEAVRRVLRLKYRCGLFAHPYAATVSLPYFRADAISLAREAAARSAVLVKNAGGILPLKPGRRIALIGPYAQSNDLLGCWSAAGGEQIASLDNGLRTALGKDLVAVEPGCDLTGDRNDGFDQALAAARNADVVILAVGEPSNMSGENHSRQNLDLPGVQDRLMERLAATGKPIITVLITGRPLIIPALLERSSALLIAWHGGIQTGPAVADLLTGASEPTGRLTASWPRSVGQIPTYYNHLSTGRENNGDMSTRYIDGPRDPLLPFGFGLGYSTFSVDQVKLDHTSTSLQGSITASATVRNTGPRQGSTVVQCYIRAHASSGGARPVRELRGYQHVTIPASGTGTVTFTLDARSLGYWLPDGTWALEPGQYTVWIGLDSTTDNQAAFTMTVP